MKRQLSLLFILLTVGLLSISSIRAQANSNLTEMQATIIVNGEELHFTKPLLNHNGSILLPMRDYFEVIEATVTWNQATQTATAIRNGQQIDLTIHAAVAFVNEKQFNLLTPAILHNGSTYVPLRFVGESLNGSVSWDEQTQTAEIQFQADGGRLTLKGKKLAIKNGSLPVPMQTMDSQFGDERRLLVSDNPELLTSQTLSAAVNTLSADVVETSQPTTKHRVFGWHLNELYKTIQLGVTVENMSTTDSIVIATTAEAAFQSSVNHAIQEIGLPLAEASLQNKLLGKNKQPISVAPGETKTLSTFELKHERLIGFLTDFTITTTGQGTAQYTIRTVASTDSNQALAAIKEPIVAIDTSANHPRGVWPSSTIQTVLPIYTIGQAPAGYSFSNGLSDHLYSFENALTTQQQTVENRGHFGASYKVQIPVVNHSKKRQGVVLQLTGRGGTYSGVVKYRGQTYIIPPMQAGTEFVQLPIDYTTKKNSTIELEFIHAGGSNLPLALYISTK